MSRKESKRSTIPQDVTVQDFADSTVSNNRLKKTWTSVLYIVRREIQIKDHWDDNDDDEITCPDENTTVSIKVKRSSTSHKRNLKTGNNYPFDIWFLISNYIAPEDIGRFAAICRTSLEVILSVQFWIALYKRYYVKERLPQEYQPECLLRYFGLKPSVIKSLFLMYPPFMTRIRQQSIGISHPDILKGKMCVAQSVHIENSKFAYYFKFKLNNSVPFYRTDSEEQSLIEMLGDIHSNRDEDHCILKVTSNDQIAIVPVFGQTLTNVSLNLSRGYFYYRLQLMFGSSTQNRSVKNGPVEGYVVIDSISQILLLNWWHPHFVMEKKLLMYREKK